jgi:hypothetical protein
MPFFSFDWPYLAVRDKKVENASKLAICNGPLRRVYGIPSLRLMEGHDVVVSRRLWIHEGQMSFAIHAASNNSWTAYFLIDEYFEKYSRLDDGGESNANGPNAQKPVHIHDPIVGREVQSTPLDPRCYGMFAWAHNANLAMKEESDLFQFLEHDVKEYRHVRRPS